MFSCGGTVHSLTILLQGMAPAAIIAVGLTWREAIYSIILGLSITAIPLVLNGAIGKRNQLS